MWDNDIAADYLNAVQSSLRSLESSQLKDVVEVLQRARSERRRVYVMGNGGSSSTASHFANDLAKGARRTDEPPVRAFSLTDNVPLLTAWSNDVSYGEALAAQIEGNVEPGDVVIGISTSGQSENVIRAFERARSEGAVTVAFVGRRGKQLASQVDYAVVVDSDRTNVIEDAHMVVSHLLAHVLLKGGHDAINENGHGPRLPVREEVLDAK